MKSDSKLLKSLEKLGLNEKEARVYLAGLKETGTSIMEISHKAGVSRTTTYSIIESLKQKGLFFEEEDGFKKHYRSASPSELQRLLDSQREEFSTIAEDLAAVHSEQASHTAINLYTGRAALRDLYTRLLDELKAGEEYLAISDTQAWFQSDDSFFRAYVEKRARKQIRTKLLLQDTPAAHDARKFGKNFNREVKILPHNIFETNLIITKNAILIHQFSGKPTALLIRNPKMISLHRQLFYLIWNQIP